MAATTLENPILLFSDPIALQQKQIKDIQLSDMLERNAIRYNDGDDEFVDMFILKVGVNGNGWGVGLDTFEQRAYEFLGLPVIEDAAGEVHYNQKYSHDHIVANQGKKQIGNVHKIKLYDTDNDGKKDLARAVIKISKEPEKKTRYHNALAAGINETSPTVLPLNFQERWDQLLTYKPINVTLTKHGAYLEHSKIKQRCLGSATSCNNALAAVLENNENNISLIDKLTKLSLMDTGNAADSSGAPAGSGSTTSAQPNGAVINIFGSGGGNAAGSSNAETQTKPEVSKEQPDKPAQLTAEQIRIAELEKENKGLTELGKSSILNELAPLDLFEGKEDAQKEFNKKYEKLDLSQLQLLKQFASDYVPRALAFLTKQGTKPTQGQGTEGSKDEKKDNNPLAGSLIPRFDNSAGVDENTMKTRAQAVLGKMTLKELAMQNRKLFGGEEQGIVL